MAQQQQAPEYPEAGVSPTQQKTQSWNHPSQSAAANPSRSMENANQRAADLLNRVNQSEIEQGKMMQSRATNDAVKDYAQMIATDHENLQNKLESVARHSNITLRTDPSLLHSGQRQDDQLKKEGRVDADQTFANDEVKDHRQAIRQLQRLEPQVTDPQLEVVVQQSIPVLQKHLQHAEQLKAQLGSPAGGM